MKKILTTAIGCTLTAGTFLTPGAASANPDYPNGVHAATFNTFYPETPAGKAECDSRVNQALTNGGFIFETAKCRSGEGPKGIGRAYFLELWEPTGLPFLHRPVTTTESSALEQLDTGWKPGWEPKARTSYEGTSTGKQECLTEKSKQEALGYRPYNDRYGCSELLQFGSDPNKNWYLETGTV